MVRPLAHLAFPHIPIRHATLLDVLLHFHTHKSCYAAGRCLALPHIRHATLLDVLLRFHTYVMLRCWTFSCASHIRHATLLDVVLHFHTYVMLHCWTLSCTSTHMSYYVQIPFWRDRQCPRQTRTTLCLKPKKRNFSTKLSGHKITVSLW